MRPQTVGGLVYLVVLAIATVGLVLAFLGDWRPGLSWVGGSLGLAGVARLVIPDDNAGMLKVRRKAFDVVMMIGFGAALVVLAYAVPGGP